MRCSNREPSRPSFSTPAFNGRREWRRILGRPPRILIVEDERDVRVSVARWFAKDGWKTRGLEDGSAFFEDVEPILEGEQTDPDIDLIIADIAMPGVDVLEILQGIRQVGCSVPVVVISGLADPELPKRIEGLERARFFSKPFSLEEVHQTARYLLLSAHS